MKAMVFAAPFFALSVVNTTSFFLGIFFVKGEFNIRRLKPLMARLLRLRDTPFPSFVFRDVRLTFSTDC